MKRSKIIKRLNKLGEIKPKNARKVLNKMDDLEVLRVRFLMAENNVKSEASIADQLRSLEYLASGVVEYLIDYF